MDRHSAPGPTIRSVAVGAAVVVVVLVLAGAGWWVWRDTRDAGPVRASESVVGLLRNGSFADGKQPWGSTERMPTTVVDGRLCAEVPGGTNEPYDVTITQNDIPLVKDQAYEWSFSASASTAGRVIRAVVGLGTQPYDAYFEDTPALGTTARRYVYPFVAPAGTTKGQVAFQVGGSAEAWRFCVDDVTLRAGGSATVYRPDTGSPVRVNQVGYLPDGPKNATVVTPANGSRPWQLKAADGSTVAQGGTVPRGMDASSGENTHTIDFSAYRTAGNGFRLVSEGQASHPFDIGGIAYQQLAVDAVKFFYTQRSGIEIQDILRPGYARPAGHLGSSPNLGDIKVPCQPKVCDHTLDVRGGWYDAGDHGKYVVNGGIAVWQLLNRFERSRADAKGRATTSGDGQLEIPESHNDVPDILDEARWELEFLLRMQVPAGREGAGMVHHKVHDERWTGLPTMPNEDPQKRELHPPSTAATLNLAATAAQAARLYGPYDERFARRSLAAAQRAWLAATARPRAYASADDSVGGGAYDDIDVSDEFYWAAAELFLTTGEQRYAAAVRGSRHHTGDVWRPLGFTWRDTAALGRLALATVANPLPDVARVRASVVEGAETYLKTAEAQPFGMPYAPPQNRFDWGSNSQILNNMVVLATAYDLTAKPAYRTAVLQGMDYLLGRNALNLSYVTGYGDVYARNQHSRWYAHQLDPDLPNPPHGSLAGGPNSGISDPVAKAKIAGCVGQFCYIDDIKSYSTNELTINWNAALAWIAAFVAGQ